MEIRVSSAREEIRKNAVLRRYRISYNASIVVDGGKPSIVVEVPRNGYSVTSEADLDVRELLAFVAAEVDPEALLVDGKPSLELIGLVELVAQALGRAARIQWERARKLEHLIEHGDWLDLCEALRPLGVKGVCSRENDGKLRELALRKLDEEKARLEALQKLQRIANALLTGLRVGKQYLDHLEIRINMPEAEKPLTKYLEAEG